MIRLSTKGRYGTRAMLELALNEGRGPLLLREIAQKQGISVKYLEQIVPVLKSAGLINSTCGAGGGYYLTKPASEITIREIIDALEGPLKLVDCIDDQALCSKTGYCVTRDLWDEVGNAIYRLLEANTLKGLAEKHRSRQESRPLMYSI